MTKTSKNFIHRILYLISKLNTLIAEKLKYVTIPLMIVIAYSVIVRYLFESPDIRTYFISLWLYGLLFVLGGAYTLLAGSHASVDILYKKLPLRWRRFLGVFDMTIVAISTAILVLVGIPIAWRSFLIWEVDSSLGILFAPPIWWYKWIGVIGSALLTIQAVVEILKRVRG